MRWGSVVTSPYSRDLSVLRQRLAAYDHVCEALSRPGNPVDFAHAMKEMRIFVEAIIDAARRLCDNEEE